jgi:hypothetical protein
MGHLRSARKEKAQGFFPHGLWHFSGSMLMMFGVTASSQPVLKKFRKFGLLPEHFGQ